MWQTTNTETETIIINKQRNDSQKIGIRSTCNAVFSDETVRFAKDEGKRNRESQLPYPETRNSGVSITSTEKTEVMS